MTTTTCEIKIQTAEDLRPYLFLSLVLQGETPESLGLNWWPRGLPLWEAPPALMYTSQGGLWHKKTISGFPNLKMEKDGALLVPSERGRDFYNYGLPSRTVVSWKPSGFHHPQEVVDAYKDTVYADGWAGSPLGNF